MATTDLIPWKKTESEPALRRRPGDPFTALRGEIDNMFDGMLRDWTGRRPIFRGGAELFVPSIDMKETAKEIRITAELPGLEEKDLEVSLLNRMLRITGEKREEHEEETGDTYQCERQFGRFERMIELPAEVDAEQVKASFKKGVLKVVLPK